jgi:NADH-quinone oxidoreductase subunit E
MTLQFVSTRFVFADCWNMKFSDQLEQRFATMVTHYPTKRSVLVPMLLYIQDELGSLTDEAIHEIAGRVELSDLEVRNVVSYYSMLRTRQIGKYNFQVCTNVSCLLRGGEDLLEHCKKKLGVANKGTTPDGLFTVEEVECIGACSWAPAMMMNYDFHENLTTEKIDQLIETLKKKEQQ